MSQYRFTPAIIDLDPGLNVFSFIIFSAALEGETFLDEIVPPMSRDLIADKVHFKNIIECLGLDFHQAEFFAHAPALNIFGRVKLLDPGQDIFPFELTLTQEKTIRSRSKHLGVERVHPWFIRWLRVYNSLSFMLFTLTLCLLQGQRRMTILPAAEGAI
jgi:hypothetical protein